MSSPPATRTARDRARDAALHQMVATTQATMTAAWAALVTARDRVLAAADASNRRTPTKSHALSPNLARELVLWNAAVATFNRIVMAAVDKWASVDLPIAYRDGAVQALRRANRNPALFTWTTAHQRAVTAMTAAAHTALATRVLETIRRAQAFGRAVRAGATSPDGIDTRALQQAYPIAFVVYSNLSRYPVAAWLASALTAQVATAANTGAVNTARDELEVYLLEVIDGDECGWTSHEDPDLANGTVRTVDDCGQYPIAHPGCIREFAPHAAGFDAGATA